SRPFAKRAREGNRNRFGGNLENRRATPEGFGSMSALTTHVLDTKHGRPAAGMKIELWSVDPANLLKSLETNSDGRTDAPLLSGEEMVAGTYELIFFVGDYFGERRFLDRVPV